MRHSFPTRSHAYAHGGSGGPDPNALRGAHSPELHELWATHRRWVAAILLAHMPREADLEDLLQEVAIRLVRGGADLKDPAAVRPWLRTVAINLARTAGRKKRVRQRLMPEYVAQVRTVSDETETANDPRAGHELLEDGRLAMSLARSLPEEYREPLLLRAVRGLSYRQIADILGVPITTIETRLTRARRMLRDEIERARQPRNTPSQNNGENQS
jgi:RNA polymerase sigma factor (sigma-70 family)